MHQHNIIIIFAWKQKSRATFALQASPFLRVLAWVSAMILLGPCFVSFRLWILYWANLRTPVLLQVWASSICLPSCYPYCTPRWGTPGKSSTYCYLHEWEVTDAIVENLGIDSILSLSKFLNLLQEELCEIFSGLAHGGCGFHFGRIVWILLHDGTDSLKWEQVFRRTGFTSGLSANLDRSYVLVIPASHEGYCCFLSRYSAS